MNEIALWSNAMASKGDNANPNIKLASNRPKLGALHFGGVTSDRAEIATANQEINPVVELAI